MADITNQNTALEEAELDFDQNTESEAQMSVINESPALAALEAKLLRRHNRAKPHTYRRPAYLQYIEYV